jgi:hypothetical protein
MEVLVTSNSQADRLRQRAEEARLRHGQEVRADVVHVRVARRPAPVRRFIAWLLRGARGPTPEPVGEVFFCEVGPLAIREELAAGDGGPMPLRVALDGLTVPDAGYYDLQNVLVRSNGDLRLVADAETRITPICGLAR